MPPKKVIKISLTPANVDMSRYFSGEFFQDYIFEINNPNCIECDFWIIHYALPNKTEFAKVDPRNIFFFTAEFDGFYNQKFLDQFQKVFTVDTRLQGENLVYGQSGQPWFINQTFDELYHQYYVKKTKLISVVASNRAGITYSRNYKIRYDFVMALKKHFGEGIDIFGRGFNELKNKDDGLLPYKFSVAIENMPLPYNVSEKLTDCLLTQTFPLYYDCPNIHRFYDEKSFAKLDIMDHRYSIKLMEKILATPNFYEDHLEAVIEAKKKFLLEYSLQAVTVNAAEKYGVTASKKKMVTIKSNNDFKSRIKLKLIDLTYNLLR